MTWGLTCPKTGGDGGIINMNKIGGRLSQPGFILGEHIVKGIGNEK